MEGLSNFRWQRLRRRKARTKGPSFLSPFPPRTIRSQSAAPRSSRTANLPVTGGRNAEGISGGLPCVRSQLSSQRRAHVPLPKFAIAPRCEFRPPLKGEVGACSHAPAAARPDLATSRRCPLTANDPSATTPPLAIIDAAQPSPAVQWVDGQSSEEGNGSDVRRSEQDRPRLLHRRQGRRGHRRRLRHRRRDRRSLRREGGAACAPRSERGRGQGACGGAPLVNGVDLQRR